MTSTPRTTIRRRLAAAVGITVAAAAVVAGAGTAHAALQPAYSPSQQTPMQYQPCQLVIGGCPVTTTKTIQHAGYYTYAYGTFPQGATGTVTYKLHCADGFSKSKTVAIAKNVSAELSVKGEHPGAQTCTVSQTVKAGFTTTVTQLPPDSDNLWPVEQILFANS